MTSRHGLPPSCIVELCGLPGAGKTWLASALGQEEGTLVTSMPALGIGPEVPTARRLSRKLGLVAAASIRRPALEATMAKRIWRSGQPRPGDTASRWVQWTGTQALMSRARQAPGVHLFDEGVIQALYLRNTASKTPLLAAVGPLQFEVVQFRLESEYGAESRLEPAPFSVVRWLPVGITEDELDALSLPTGSRVAYDLGNHPVILFANDWAADYFPQTNPKVPLSALPVQTKREF